MWALLHWLYPDVFPVKTANLFTSAFDLSRGRANLSFMDNVRHLLELVMLRRTKSSPNVSLGLPPKVEILLYVPLAPMQRFWYTRLLTRAGDNLLEDIFRNVRDKEKDALEQKAEDDEKISSLETLRQNPDTVDGAEWKETNEILRETLLNERVDTSRTTPGRGS